MEVAAQSDVSPFREITFLDGSRSRVTNYLGHLDELSDGPQAFLVEYHAAPGGSIKAHFHHVRQFQVFVGGSGRVGKHPVPPISLHYNDPDSPYGPIVPGDDGIVYFTLRPRGVKGSYYMPGSKQAMHRRAGRNLVFWLGPAGGSRTSRTELIERQPDGLAALALRLAPYEEAAGPDPAGSGGQFVMVCHGSLDHDGLLLEPYSLLWAHPNDPSPAFRTTGDGAELLVLQCPRADAAEDAGRETEVSFAASDYHPASGIAAIVDSNAR